MRYLHHFLTYSVNVEHSAFYTRIEPNALLVLLSEEFKTYI